MLGVKQQAFLRESTATVNLLEGSIRSGKTVVSLIRFVIAVAQFIRRRSSGEIVIIGRTRDSVWRNVVGPLQDANVTGSEVAAQVVGNYGAPTVSILGRRIYVMGASDVKAELTLRGLTVGLAYVDEITTIPELFFVQLLGRMSVEGAQLFGTTNPDGPRHWLKVNYLDRLHELPHWRRWHFTMADNPGLTEAYKAQKSAEFAGLWYLRFIEGRWVQAEGAIYEQWDEKLHLVDELPHNLVMLGAGVDYGTTNPARGVRLGYGGDPIRLYVIDEWDPPKGTEAQRSASLRAWLAAGRPVPWVAVDPAAAGFKQQLFADGLSNVISASNAVLPGIRVVSSLLAADRLRVHRSCSALIDEIPGYMWDPKKTEKGEDAPIKLNDHSCFIAGTPVLTIEGERPIEQVRPHDLVLTRSGWRPVVSAGMTDAAASVIRVELSDGRTLTGTGNHPVWVEGHGWKPLDSLRYADKLVTWENALRSSCSTASSSVDTPMRKGSRISGTSRPASPIGNAALDGSTKRSGRPRTDATSQPDTTFTTPTATTTTTRPRTWFASLRMSIERFTRRILAATASVSTGSTTRAGRRPGTALTPDGNGTARTGSACGKAARSELSPASNAAATTRRSPSAAMSMSASAPTPASRHGAGCPESTTRTALASGAATHSRSTATPRPDAAAVRVVRVSVGPTVAPVWNLKVADCPEYFASGVLVHNCDALRYATYSTRHVWRQAIPIITAADTAPGTDNEDGRAAA